MFHQDLVKFLFLVAEVTVAITVCRGDVVINEIDVDQIGTDRAEFVELYNSGPDEVDFDLVPHVLVLFNGGDETLPIIDGSYRAVALAGCLEPGDFLLIGSPLLPNVDLLLGDGEINLIQNGTDAVAIYLGTASDWQDERPPTTEDLVDAIVYHTDDEEDQGLQAALGLSDQYDEWAGRGSPGVVFSIARDPDGGSFQTGATPTPGRSNDASAPVLAFDGVTLLHRAENEPVEVALAGDGGMPPIRFRILTLPSFATLFDDGVEITGSGPTELPYQPIGVLECIPMPGFSGVDRFEFEAVDSGNRTSESAVQELAVQIGGVVISEIMHSPGIFGHPQDQRVYEFIEIFNHADNDIELTRIDTSINEFVDTTDNMVVDGAPAVIPAHSMRIVAPGGLTDDSDEAFACEWGLDEGDILRIPYERYETMVAGARILLFGRDAELIDAVNLSPPDFWTPIPGASQSVKEAYLDFFDADLDSVGNDPLIVWPYSGPENQQGLRLSYSGIGQGSPGFVPDDLNEDFVPLPPCELPPIGACCLPDGRCPIMSSDDCDEWSGAYAGDNVLCDENDPCLQPPAGACCTPTGECLETDPFRCADAGGDYLGDDVTCDEASCAALVTIVINEIEYTQAGDDAVEYIELYGQAGLFLFGYELVLYNGDPEHRSMYRTIELEGVIPGDGHFVIGSSAVPEVDQIAFTTDGIQNGAPDGIALVDPFGEVIKRLAYGGSFVAADGPAAGMLFADIGVEDVAPIDGDPTDEVTLQRIPNGIGPWSVTTDHGLGEDGTPGRSNRLPLPRAYGACCLPDGACVGTVEEPLCTGTGGSYRGDGTTCDKPCPVLLGACCLPNGECTLLDETACQQAIGDYYGDGTQCDEVPECQQPPVGACCLAGGGCVVEDPYDCTLLSGEYRGDGTTCGEPEDPICGEPRELKINEIYRNDAGVDDLEFIELYGPGGFNLTPFTLVEIEGDHGQTGQEGKIDEVWSLAGLVIPGDGFFVIGDEAVADVDLIIGKTNTLENGTATYLLIQDYDPVNYPRGTDIDMDNDGEPDPGVELGQILDGIAIVDPGIDEAPPQVDRTYFGVVEFGPDSSAAPAGAARRSDGWDTEDPSDFCSLGEAGDGSDWLSVPTPGSSNTCSTCMLPGDASQDGVVGLLDFAWLQTCFTGALGPISPPAYGVECRCLDFDVDGDIDLTDYSRFQAVR